MRILFLNKMRDGGFRAFDYASLEGMRGGERTVMYLADALARRGHAVTVSCAGAPAGASAGGVAVADPTAVMATDFDVAVSNNFAHAFDGIRAPLKVIWTHNPGFSRAHIRADLIAKLRHRPYLVHLSRYTERRSWFLPRRGQTVIRHGMPADLLGRFGAREKTPPPVAVFASYAGRNLRKVVEAWRDVVHRRVPAARLVVTSEAAPKHLAHMTQAQLAAINIELAGTLPWTQLMQLFGTARLLVAPGHFQETYNLLSIEAAACGLPTVTMGIGALRERVIHDETGQIAPTRKALGEALVKVLTDDALWLRYHRGCLVHPDLVSWEQRALEWERYLDAIGRSGGAIR